MTSTVTIPAGAIADAREALLCLLGDPVESIAHTLTLPERELHPEWFGDNRRQFEGVCRLLDTIGWDAGAPPHKVQITSADAYTIRAAIECYVPLVEQWLAEAERLSKRQEYRQSAQAMWALLAALREIAPQGGDA